MSYLTRRRFSPLVRASLLIYFLLIVYASLYPFSGWRDPGVIPTAFLFLPLPRYWTWFDVITNVIGYMPFGALLVLALPRSIPRFLAFLIAVAAGVLLSMTVEAIQSFLPSRVSSNLDFFTNILGTCIGAFLGVLYRFLFTKDISLYRFYKRWFWHDGASRVLIVPLLWPIAQIYPQAYLFGQGQIVPILSDWLSRLMGIPVDLAAFIRLNVILTPEHYWLSETIITASGLSGAALTLLYILDQKAPRVRLVCLLVFSALTVKTLASALLFTPGNAFVWLTPGAVAGILVGGLMLFGLMFAPSSVQRRSAIVMMMISLIMVNVIPDNQYFLSTLQTWAQGKFLHFNGAAQFLALIWPLMAIWFLLQPTYKALKSA